MMKPLTDLPTETRALIERLRKDVEYLEAENVRLYGLNLDMRADLSRIPNWVKRIFL